MEVVAVTDATTGQVGGKNRPGRGSPCKGAWHTPASTDMAPAFGVGGK